MGTAQLPHELLDERTVSLSFDGEIDSAASLALERAVLTATRDGKNQLLVDLTGVRIADASPVESLLHVGHLVEHHCGTLW